KKSSVLSSPVWTHHPKIVLLVQCSMHCIPLAMTQ
ncbi:bacterial regulatory s, lacI family protein, partial [Vibrio parahaemolyticus V-223/04]